MRFTWFFLPSRSEISTKVVPLRRSSTWLGAGWQGPIIEHDASTERRELVVVHRAVHECDVGLLNMVRGVKQRVPEVAVRGEEQQTRRIKIKPSYWEEPGMFGHGYEFGHARSPLGVAHRRKVARRLVEHEIHRLIAPAHAHPVNLDDIDVGVDLRPQFRCHDTVHHYATGCHERLGSPAARHAGSRQKPLQAHRVRMFVSGLSARHRSHPSRRPR